jgi:hypothetical protein
VGTEKDSAAIRTAKPKSAIGIRARSARSAQCGPSAAPPPRIHQKSKALNTHAGWENKKTGPGIFCRKEAQKSIGK